MSLPHQEQSNEPNLAESHLKKIATLAWSLRSSSVSYTDTSFVSDFVVTLFGHLVQLDMGQTATKCNITKVSNFQELVVGATLTLI